jgi:long-chain fatty acid transport protein
MLRTLKLKVGLALSFSVLSATAYAGGYEIIGHSSEGTGTSYVGAVTGFSDGSAAHYNPGALSAIEKTTISFGGHVVPINYDFHNKNSSVVGLPAAGSDAGEDSFTGLLPDLYIVQPFCNGLTAAFSMTSPYGLGSRYDADWIGRYQGVDGELLTVKTGASLAYQMTDSLSFGATLSHLYAEAQLENAIDFGTIGYSVLGAQTAGQFGLFPQQADGYSKLKGHDNALGWNAGVLYRYGEDNRIGVAYRGKTKLHLSGYADFDVPDQAALLTSQGAFTDTKFSTDLTLPEQVTFGLQHWISDQVAFLYESMWNRWSRFDSLVVDFSNPVQPDAVQGHHWRNTWRHGVGFKYVPGGDWDFRSGFYFDQSAITSPANRGVLLPITNEYNIGVGATYHWSDELRVAMGFVHTFFDNASSYTEGPTGDLLDGKWKGNSIEIYSLGLIYSFN